MKKILSLTTVVFLSLIPATTIASYTPNLTDTQKEEIIELIDEQTNLENIKLEISQEGEAVLEDINEKSETQTRNFIEIIGLFSAVMAFIVINIGAVKAATKSSDAMLLIIGFTCSLVIFAYLIHYYFGSGNNTTVWIPVIAIVILLVLFFFSHLSPKSTHRSGKT